MVLILSLADCGVNCHKKCQPFMPNLCGVNQKILSELLDTIKSSGSMQIMKNEAKTPPQKTHSLVSLVLYCIVLYLPILYRTLLHYSVTPPTFLLLHLTFYVAWTFCSLLTMWPSCGLSTGVALTNKTNRQLLSTVFDGWCEWRHLTIIKLKTKIWLKQQLFMLPVLLVYSV